LAFAAPALPRRPQSAKTLFWHWLSNSLAMSPRLTPSGPQRLLKSDRPLSHRIRELVSLSPGPQPSARAAKDFVPFRFGTNGGAPLQNPKDFGFAGGDPMPPRCRRCEPWFLAATSDTTGPSSWCLTYQARIVL